MMALQVSSARDGTCHLLRFLNQVSEQGTLLSEIVHFWQSDKLHDPLCT